MNPLAFGYKPFYLAAVFACSFVPVVVSVFICLMASSKPSVRAVLFLLSCGSAGTALFAYGYRYLKSFRITVQDAGVTVAALHRRRSIPFDGFAVGEIGGAGAATVARVASTAGFGVASGVGGNAVANIDANKPPMKRAGYAATLGGFSPLISGEAAVVAAGEFSGLTGLGEGVFGGISAAVGDVGGELDPLKDCAIPEPPVPPADYHFPYASIIPN